MRYASAPCHPAKKNPGAGDDTGAQVQAARMGGSYPAALVTGTATLLPVCSLAPPLPTKCELLHIGRLFVVILLHRPM